MKVKLGELAADFDPELGALVLSGPIFYCRLMSPTPFPQKKVEKLVDSVLRATNLKRARGI